MHKYQLLRQRAEEFRRVLEEYAKADRDVEDFKNRFQPWYERASQRELRLPCYEYQLGTYFNNPDISPLVERYSFALPRHPLAEASTHFSEAIRDRLSDPLYLDQIRQGGRRTQRHPRRSPSSRGRSPTAIASGGCAAGHGLQKSAAPLVPEMNCLWRDPGQINRSSCRPTLFSTRP